MWWVESGFVARQTIRLYENVKTNIAKMIILRDSNTAQARTSTVITEKRANN